MMAERIKVRVQNYRAELQPDRNVVDIWRDVDWCGQWPWVPQTGLGDRLSGSKLRVPEEMIGRLAAKLRELGQ